MYKILFTHHDRSGCLFTTNDNRIVVLDCNQTNPNFVLKTFEKKKIAYHFKEVYLEDHTEFPPANYAALLQEADLDKIRIHVVEI